MTHLVDGWTRKRPGRKLVWIQREHTCRKAMLEVITGLILDVQVIPPKAFWHLSELGNVQQLEKRPTSSCAMHEGRTREFSNMACTAHNRLLKRGSCMPCELSFGHEPKPPEMEPLQPQLVGWDLTSYMRNAWVRQNSVYRAQPEAEAEDRVSRLEPTT